MVAAGPSPHPGDVESAMFDINKNKKEAQKARLKAGDCLLAKKRLEAAEKQEKIGANCAGKVTGRRDFDLNP